MKLNLKSSLLLLPLSFGAAFSVISCSSSFEGSYGDANQVEVLDDRWNPTDARLTVEKMVKDMGAAPWIQNWRDEDPYKPEALVAWVLIHARIGRVGRSVLARPTMMSRNDLIATLGVAR